MTATGIKTIIYTNFCAPRNTHTHTHTHTHTQIHQNTTTKNQNPFQLYLFLASTLQEILDNIVLGLYLVQLLFSCIISCDTDSFKHHFVCALYVYHFQGHCLFTAITDLTLMQWITTDPASGKLLNIYNINCQRQIYTVFCVLSIIWTWFYKTHILLTIQIVHLQINR